MLKLAGIADADAKAARHLRPRDEDRRASTRRATESEDVVEGEQPWARADFAAKAPGLDWTAFFAAARPRPGRRSSSGSPGAVTGIAALVAQRAARGLEGLPDLPRDRPRTPTSCPRRSSTSASPSTARRCPARRSSATAGSAPSSTNDALGEAVGKLYVAAATFPPAAKAQLQAMVTNISPPSTAASTRSTGWRRRRRRRRRRSSRRSTSAIGYPDKWRDYSALEVVRGDALGNAERAGAVRVPAQPREARQARRPRRVVDDAADGERGEPAAAERAELPGRDPRAAVLRSPRPTRR